MRRAAPIPGAGSNHVTFQISDFHLARADEMRGSYSPHESIEKRNVVGPCSWNWGRSPHWRYRLPASNPRRQSASTTFRASSRLRNRDDRRGSGYLRDDTGRVSLQSVWRDARWSSRVAVRFGSRLCSSVASTGGANGSDDGASRQLHSPDYCFHR